MTRDAEIAQWRRAKRATRARPHRQRLDQMTDQELMGWLLAVECDDLHDFQHHLQDAMIAQNTRRIRELEAEQAHVKEHAA